MARLFAGEKDCKADDVLKLLQQYEYGLSEAEAANLLGWERRTVNNYLHALQGQGLVYKEGRLWFAE